MFSLRTKINISFISIVLIIGVISVLVGIYFINEGVIKQAREKVGTDLNSAREIYKREINSLSRGTDPTFYIPLFSLVLGHRFLKIALYDNQ